MPFRDLISAPNRSTLDAIRNHAATILDRSPRFRYFTLHGSSHLDGIFRVLDLFTDTGINLSSDAAFLLGISACIHDLGMVARLSDAEVQSVLGGSPQAQDPAYLEPYIRDRHHELIASYVDQHFSFLAGLGLTPSDIGLLKDIARNHRRTNLLQQRGYARTLGALLRIADELDIGPQRAPVQVLRQHAHEMDDASCWHWFKHNIVELWRRGHNVTIDRSVNPRRIVFQIIARPTHKGSVQYWLTQTIRPILRVLHDEGAAKVIKDDFNLDVEVSKDTTRSTPNALDEEWSAIEHRALSAGRKVILLIDDEQRKMEDLFLPLMDAYHVVFSPNAKDALVKLQAMTIDLAIVDIQLGSGSIWSAADTQSYKGTGLRLYDEIRQRFPKTKIGFLTGTRYEFAPPAPGYEFYLKKPVDPDKLESEVKRVLG